MYCWGWNSIEVVTIAASLFVTGRQWDQLQSCFSGTRIWGHTWRHARWPPSLESLGDSHAGINPFVLARWRKGKYTYLHSTWSIWHFYSLWTVLKSIMQVAESLYGLLSTSLSALKCFSVCKWVKLYKVDYVDWDVGCWMLSRPRVGLQVTSLMGDSRERKLEQGGTRSVWETGRSEDTAFPEIDPEYVLA